MSIKDKAIEKYSEKNIIPLRGDQTLDEAIQQLVDKGYPENDAYLVVALPETQFMVALFSDLVLQKAKMSAEDLIKPLAELPIPLAHRVIPKNTSETSDEVWKWVVSHPGSRVVIFGEQGEFVALFANQDMGGDPYGDYSNSAQPGQGQGYGYPSPGQGQGYGNPNTGPGQGYGNPSSGQGQGYGNPNTGPGQGYGSGPNYPPHKK